MDAQAAPSSALVSLLWLEFPEPSCAVLHDDLDAIEGLEPGTAGACDLDREVGGCAAEGARWHALRVVMPGSYGYVITRATLRISSVPPTSLFSLPSVLREAGCAPWLRGFVPLGVSVGPERIGLWLDLQALIRGGVHDARK